MNEIPVELGPRRYPVWIRDGLLAQAGARVRGLFRNARRVIVIADRRVLTAHGGTLRESLRRARLAPTILSVPPGEGRKTLAMTGRLIGRMLAAGADRATPLLAFGGGVIGDLAGFVAATYMRGIPFVQIPTTLLAQVDASVGGKVAVNHPQAKNLIGAFHQPAAVLIDPRVLGTLPAREFRSGLAECVKAAVVRDADYFQFLEKNADAILGLDRFAVRKAISVAVSIKADIVARDERESGLRMLLNYGHTLGHAIESATRYRTYLHGEAVSIGMTLAGRIAVARGTFPEAHWERQTLLLSRMGLPVRHRLDAVTLLRLARHDKKARGGKLRFVLPGKLGRATVDSDVTDTEVLLAIRAARVS